MNQKNYGFRLGAPTATDYQLGALTKLPREVLQEDGDWSAFLPVVENQSTASYETQACVSFSTLNACEILAKRKYNEELNWSDRWLSWSSDTDPVGGNTYNQVLETLRKGGCPLQEKWDTPEVTNVEEWYKTPPPKLIKDAREDFLSPYEFKHEYVDATQVLDALKYAPVNVAVSAWYLDSDGLYYTPEDAGANHAVLCIGYSDRYGCWELFDSYDNNRKFYKGTIFQAKRVWIGKRDVPTPSRFGGIISTIWQWFQK